MNPEHGPCIFCKRQASIWRQIPWSTYRCPNCGDYSGADALLYIEHALNTQYDSVRYLFSGYLREHTERGWNVRFESRDSLEEILASGELPRTIMARMEKLLWYLYAHSQAFGDYIQLTYSEGTAFAYARHEQELIAMLSALDDLGYIDADIATGFAAVKVTATGMAHAEQQQSATQSNQCFVAMWFDAAIAPVYASAIHPAVESAGFDCLRIDEKPHNDKICDQIVAEIRRSHFLIADFSGHRGGVYYEAGFAAGLGLPVIFTCREDFVDSLHFDIRQYNCVVWEAGKEDDFREKLKYRILATIPGAQERVAVL